MIRPDQPGFQLIPEPIGVAPEVDCNGMVQDEVQGRRGNDTVPEHLTPRAELWLEVKISGLLITPADELEEQVGAGLVDGEKSALIDDQQPGHGVGLEFLLQFPLARALPRAAILLAAVVNSTR